jgi:hypothetical protein
MTAKPKTQVQKFREAARDLETDDDEKRFDERLGKIAKAKPDGALKQPRKSAKKRA